MKRFFIVVLILVDAFFISYAVGLNLRMHKIVDASLPPVQTKIDATTGDTTPAVEVKPESGSSTASNTAATKPEVETKPAPATQPKSEPRAEPKAK